MLLRWEPQGMRLATSMLAPQARGPARASAFWKEQWNLGKFRLRSPGQLLLGLWDLERQAEVDTSLRFLGNSVVWSSGFVYPHTLLHVWFIEDLLRRLSWKPHLQCTVPGIICSSSWTSVGPCQMG